MAEVPQNILDREVDAYLKGVDAATDKDAQRAYNAVRRHTVQPFHCGTEAEPVSHPPGGVQLAIALVVGALRGADRSAGRWVIDCSQPTTAPMIAVTYRPETHSGESGRLPRRASSGPAIQSCWTTSARPPVLDRISPMCGGLNTVSPSAIAGWSSSTGHSRRPCHRGLVPDHHPAGPERYQGGVVLGVNSFC
jgi:hypothetical protein